MDWLGDAEWRYNVYPPLCPGMVMLHKGEPVFIGKKWG
jgi:hypothetical protein